MKIVACCKVVPDEQDIVILSNNELSFDKATWKIGQYDLNALEAGKVLASQVGGTLIGLSAGDAVLNGSKIRKDICSRGIDELNLVVNEKKLTDTLQTAKVLANAVKAIGDVDVVLCGTGSSDMYSQEVGIQLGTLLDWPVINNISNIIPKEGNLLELERTLENEIEILEISLPAVISVTVDINTPAIPGMKDIMKAGKKPVKVLDISLDEILPKIETLSQLSPEQTERKNIVIEGDSEEHIDQLVKFLKKEVL